MREADWVRLHHGGEVAPRFIANDAADLDDSDFELAAELSLSPLLLMIEPPNLDHRLFREFGGARIVFPELTHFPLQAQMSHMARAQALMKSAVAWDQERWIHHSIIGLLFHFVYLLK
jgi:hypothetical protein